MLSAPTIGWLRERSGLAPLLAVDPELRDLGLGDNSALERLAEPLGHETAEVFSRLPDAGTLMIKQTAKIGSSIGSRGPILLGLVREGMTEFIAPTLRRFP
jgi:hypothetical protein